MIAPMPKEYSPCAKPLRQYGITEATPVGRIKPKFPTQHLTSWRVGSCGVLVLYLRWQHWLKNKPILLHTPYIGKHGVLQIPRCS